MLPRINYSSNAPWESQVGYSRAVRVGNIIEISGTVAADEQGRPVAKGDAYAQTKFIIDKLGRILSEAGGSISDVVRTRMFVTDIARWQEYGKAHGEAFGSIRPCTSMIGVNALIDAEYLIEIEATAIITS